MPWTSRFDFIAEKFCGNEDDWMDAIEALGVRPMQWDGCHRAYLGKNKSCWTNATVAIFNTREEARDWCERVNEIFEVE